MATTTTATASSRTNTATTTTPPTTDTGNFDDQQQTTTPPGSKRNSRAKRLSNSVIEYYHRKVTPTHNAGVQQEDGDERNNSRPLSKMSDSDASSNHTSNDSGTFQHNVYASKLSKDTPPEMVPILTLLNAHQTREYYDGYFMLLNDLNTDGKPVHDRRWMEVYGKLTGTILSIWDADSLNEANTGGGEPTPTYINITDATFKSISTLPSPSGDLNNIVVLSTTSKNRYLLQFASPTTLQDWTAALRLSVFEYTSLQEAYTGALLSAKGSRLNGIRTLLSETKYRHEDWVSVRFGSGMPWKKCWTIITPDDKKNKKEKYAPMGTIAFFEDKKKTKKPPLATITAAYSGYAVYPQSSVLVNNSTLIKVEGKVIFGDSNGEEKESPIFLMPEPHPGVLGFETLIRFLIPVLDVFKLYGRPKRLNADKADMRSLLFGMPTLPRTQYLDRSDLSMIVGLKGSENWTSHEWTKNIKDLLARKIATGYKGAGHIDQPQQSKGPNNNNRDRSVSMPPSGPPKQQQSSSPTLEQQRQPSPPQNQPQQQQPKPPPHYQTPPPQPPQHYQAPQPQYYQRQAPAPPPHQQQQPPPNAHRPQPKGPPASAPMGPQPQRRPQQPQQYQQQQYQQQQQRPYPQQQQQPPPRYHNSNIYYNHERSASQGADPNNLLSKVTPGSTQPISPTLNQLPERKQSPEKSAARTDIKKSIFYDPENNDQPTRSESPYVNGRMSPRGPRENAPTTTTTSSSPERSEKRNSWIKRKPLPGSEEENAPLDFTPQQQPRNIFDPTVHGQ